MGCDFAARTRTEARRIGLAIEKLDTHLQRKDNLLAPIMYFCFEGEI